MKNALKDTVRSEAIYTIQSGINSGCSLKNTRHGVEAERLLTYLAAKSHRVHGPAHGVTNRAELNLQKCMTRHVVIKYQSKVHFFQFMRWEAGGERCVVQGPIASFRREDTRFLHIGYPPYNRFACLFD